jgi:acyl-CoA reductase-like NAD-dependent aldehyde dehydrogenase
MLAERAGRTLKRTVLELGGFNPMIILDDVDMDYAVRTATFGSFFHQDQICLNTRRIIIQRKIYEEFLTKFVARTNSLPAGDPLNPKTIIGPIITRAAVKMIDDRVKEAIARGAKAHTGAKYDGQIYYPTILTDVPLDAAIANEETFGRSLWSKRSIRQKTQSPPQIVPCTASRHRFSPGILTRHSRWPRRFSQESST